MSDTETLVDLIATTLDEAIEECRLKNAPLDVFLDVAAMRKRTK